MVCVNSIGRSFFIGVLGTITDLIKSVTCQVLAGQPWSTSLDFCSSSSKAKPEAMQEIQCNTSVDPCLDLPNGLMRPYLAVPTHLMELSVEFFTLSWAVERWNLLSMSFLLSLFFKINRT
jgi:hypothetical protein